MSVASDAQMELWNVLVLACAHSCAIPRVRRLTDFPQSNVTVMWTRSYSPRDMPGWHKGERADAGLSERERSKVTPFLRNRERHGPVSQGATTARAPRRLLGIVVAQSQPAIVVTLSRHPLCCVTWCGTFKSMADSSLVYDLFISQRRRRGRNSYEAETCAFTVRGH